MAFFHRLAGFRLVQATPKTPSSAQSLISQVSPSFPNSNNPRFLTFNESLASPGYQHAFSSASFRAFVKSSQPEEPDTPKKTKKSKKKSSASSGSESDGQSSETSDGSPVSAGSQGETKPKKRGRKSKAVLEAEALLAEAEAAEARESLEKLSVAEAPTSTVPDTSVVEAVYKSADAAAPTTQEEDEVEEEEEEVVEDGVKKKRKRIYKRMKPDPNPNREFALTMRALANKQSKPLSPKWISYVLSRCGAINKATEAVQLFEAYFERAGQLNDQLYGALIGALSSNLSRSNPYRDNQISNVFKYFEQMRAAKLPIDVSVWTNVVRAIGAMKRGDGKTQRVDKLRADAEASGAQLDLQFYNSLLYAYVKSGEQQRSESLFEEIQKRFPDSVNAPTYNAMIDLATDLVDFDRLWALYEQMLAKGIAPDEYTFIRMINLCGKQKKLDRAQELFEQLRKKDAKPGVFVWTALIDTYCRASQLRKAFELVEDMKTQGTQPDKVTWNILRQACIRTRQMDLWKKHRPSNAPADKASKFVNHKRRGSAHRDTNRGADLLEEEDAEDDEEDAEEHQMVPQKDTSRGKISPALVVPGVTRWKHRPDEAQLRAKQAARRAASPQRRQEPEEEDIDEADEDIAEEISAAPAKGKSVPFASAIGERAAARGRSRANEEEDDADEEESRPAPNQFRYQPRHSRSPQRFNNKNGNSNSHRQSNFARGGGSDRPSDRSDRGNSGGRSNAPYRGDGGRADSSSNWRRPHNAQGNAFNSNRSNNNNQQRDSRSGGGMASGGSSLRPMSPPRRTPLPRDYVDFKRNRNAQQKMAASGGQANAQM